MGRSNLFSDMKKCVEARIGGGLSSEERVDIDGQRRVVEMRKRMVVAAAG